MSVLRSLSHALRDGKTRRRLILVAVAAGAVKLALGLGAGVLAWRAFGG